MAKRRKTSSGDSAKAENIEDAEIVSETTSDGETLDAELAKEAKEAAAEIEDAAEETVAEVEETVAEVVETEPESPQTDPVEEPVAEVAPVIPPQEVTVQKVGFVPLALGGLVAGAIGYGAALFGQEPAVDYQSLIDAQGDEIEALASDVAALPNTIEVPDLAPVEDALAALDAQAAVLDEAQGSLMAEIDTTSGLLAAIDERLTAVERAPGEDGAVTETAIASFERELDGLREDLASQQSRMQQIAEEATAELSAAREAAAADLAAVRADAEAQEAAARAEAEAALAAAAVAELRVAAESGAPFEEAVAKLDEIGIAVPETLASAAAEGIPTQAALTSAFPDLARAALDAARSSGVADEGSGGVSSFFRDQLGVRSVEPREGDDPDAVLSRAEAAVQSGDLATALTEIGALPEPVQATLADWTAQAQGRSDALSALSELDSSVN